MIYSCLTGNKFRNIINSFTDTLGNSLPLDNSLSVFLACWLFIFKLTAIIAPPMRRIITMAAKTLPAMAIADPSENSEKKTRTKQINKKIIHQRMYHEVTIDSTHF